MTSRTIKKALYFAAEKHDGQYRKGGHVPYIVHPVLVAFNVLAYTNDEEIISAAILHDVLEDCADVSVVILQKEFGHRITQLVREVSLIESEKDTRTSWREKKEIYLEKINNISMDALIIVAADKINNMQTYFEALQNNSDAVERSFGGTPGEYYWYYTEIADILSTKLGEHRIVKDYKDILNSYKKKSL